MLTGGGGQGCLSYAVSRIFHRTCCHFLNPSSACAGCLWEVVLTTNPPVSLCSACHEGTLLGVGNQIQLHTRQVATSHSQQALAPSHNTPAPTRLGGTQITLKIAQQAAADGDHIANIEQHAWWLPKWRGPLQPLLPPLPGVWTVPQGGS